MLKQGMVEFNFRGERLPTATGWFLVCYISVSVLFLATLLSIKGNDLISWKILLLFLVGSIAIGFLGWLDDSKQDYRNKGIVGHLRAFLSDGYMTSGMIKALVGSFLSIIISLTLSSNFFLAILNALLLGISLNFINLFDIRPARAIKVFWICFICLFLLAPILFTTIPFVFVLPVVSATWLMFQMDASGEVLLGDTGSNYLGFLLGFCLIFITSIWIKTALILILFVLQIAAERYSFSRWISKNDIVDKIDRFGTIRQK
ncbi:hypothetical protein [Brevibacillus daliensis]|uniref:hypothetical protein n=1 Tax=Brevibacillus daliensis TaxID=2892995 RepID=UPI001E62148C|nr:hypothetical protein [Brevibacillus daliensis]